MRRRHFILWLIDYGILFFLLIALITGLIAVFPTIFLEPHTLTIFLRQVAMLGVVTIGLSFVVMVGGMDLSVGSILCVSSLVCALLLHSGYPLPVALLATLCTGTFCGLVNGIIISRLKISPLIATFGLLLVWRGIGSILVQGMPVYGFKSALSDLGRATFLYIPYTLVVLVLVYILAAFILRHTSMGQHIVGVGGNPDASRFSGIGVKFVKCFCYAFCGLLCAVGGLLLLSRTNSGQLSAGFGMELQAISALALGGFCFTGGRGHLFLAVIGTIFISVVNSSMLMLNLDESVQWIVSGSVLVLALAYAQLSNKVHDRIISKPRYQL